MNTIIDNIRAIHERIVAAAAASGRDPADVRLVGVSKTYPPEAVAAALAAGLSEMGENRVQEAEAKIEALAADRPRLTWHLIGHLQSNKARRAAALFDMVHSVDSLRLAEALARHAREQGRAPLDILLQVNVSGEASKEGFELAGWERRPELLAGFAADAERIAALDGVRLRGLMTIAPWGTSAEEARPCFRSARALRDELAQRVPQASWRELSMGMSGDFEAAIAEGATIVRVGRAIFGERATKL